MHMPFKPNPLPEIPAAITALARRVGVTNKESSGNVHLEQTGTMRNGPEAKFRKFRATQTISLSRPEFTWRAKTGPLGAIKITDVLAEGRGDIRVRVFGLVPLARIGGDSVTKGEILRYLAELPWAPDALLANRSLRWRIVDNGVFAVSSGMNSAAGEVQLRVGMEGLITSMSALRPRAEGDNMVDRPWRGRFSDYRWHQGRLIPFQGEVGWVVNGREFTVWRGGITEWSIV
jgi:hypothetical protein